MRPAPCGYSSARNPAAADSLPCERGGVKNRRFLTEGLLRATNGRTYVAYLGAVGNREVTIPQSASLTAPFTQGSLWAALPIRSP